MDPVTVVGLVEGSISLAVQCGSVAKNLNNLAGQYKYAKLTLSTMVQNLDIMQLAWDRIGSWSKDFIPDQNDGLAQRLERFLETGALVLDALEDDLQPYNSSSLTFSQRSRLIWNENILQAHQNRIRDQAQSMTLLLQAIQLPTPEAIYNLLQQSKKQFMKSDESAFSIVPSRLSSRLSSSTVTIGHDSSIDDTASLEYRRLSFEDDLFSAMVYKRNYRNFRSLRLKKEDIDIDNRTITRRHSHSDCDSNGSQDADIFYETVTTQEEEDQIIDKPRLQKSRDGESVAELCAKNVKDVEDNSTQLALQLVPGTNARRSGVLREETIHGLESPASLSTPDEDIVHVKEARSQEQRGTVPYPRREVYDLIKGHLTSLPALKDLLSSHPGDSPDIFQLYKAIIIGSVRNVRGLLECLGSEYGVSTNAGKKLGRTKYQCWQPLHVATTQNNLLMVELLLEFGASVCGKTERGVQAIHVAAGIRSVEILAALVDAGADPICEDHYGLQPLHYALSNNNLRNSLKILQYLEDRGADMHGTKCADELKPLHWVCQRDFSSLLDARLSLGALLSLREGKGGFSDSELQSALDTAIRHGSYFPILILTHYGVSPNSCRSDGGSGLVTVLRSSRPASATSNRLWELCNLQQDLFAAIKFGKILPDSPTSLHRREMKTTIADLARLLWDNLSEHGRREPRNWFNHWKEKNAEPGHEVK